MSGLPKASVSARVCPFCGLLSGVPHESQEGCIAALHTEIGRMRGILATLRPAGAPDSPDEHEASSAAAVRIKLD